MPTMPPLNTIIQGDCVEVMRSWPDKCVDLIVTDPPYGMNYHSNYYKGGYSRPALLNLENRRRQNDLPPLQSLRQVPPQEIT